MTAPGGRDRASTQAEAARVIAVVRRQLRIFGASLAAGGVVVPLLLVAAAAATGESPTRMLAEPRNPLAWISSVQLLLIAMLAYLNQRTAPAGGGADRAWWVAAGGFLFLALDERFEIHEALRRGWFEPAGLFSGTWIEAGDIGLHLYLLAGLACSWFLRAPLRRCPPAAALYVAALAASAVLVLVGGLDPSIVHHAPLPRFWDSIFDAVGKLWAQVLFLMAFLVVLDRQLAARQ